MSNKSASSHLNLPIYLDYAATSPVHPQVLEAMSPYFTEMYGNSASLYSLGLQSREAVDNARSAVAKALNASSGEIVFTSGGTESDNMAIRGAAQAKLSRGKHLLTTPIEHHAVLETMERLEHEGFEIEMIPVDCEGMIDLSEVEKRLRPDTTVVSVMHANNEIGTILPISEIGALCRAKGAIFHTDAVQTFGKIPIDVKAMSIDLLSISAHKLQGPKGVGALYVRRGVTMTRFQDGGEQEKGRRGGTLNVPGIVGLGRATELAIANQLSEFERLSILREYFFRRISEDISRTKVNGSRSSRLPMNVHVCIEGVHAETLLLSLDMAGICASAGSACSSGSEDPSHVLKAIGMSSDSARSALRMTIGASTTQIQIDYVVDTLAKAVSDLRKMSASCLT